MDQIQQKNNEKFGLQNDRMVEVGYVCCKLKYSKTTWKPISVITINKSDFLLTTGVAKMFLIFFARGLHCHYPDVDVCVKVGSSGTREVFVLFTMFLRFTISHTKGELPRKHTSMSSFHFLVKHRAQVFSSMLRSHFHYTKPNTNIHDKSGFQPGVA